VVFQLYKTTACFATCWLALAWVDFRFTWWGVVGAAIWVVNGTLAIVAVQKAGLGIAQSIWSGLSSTSLVPTACSGPKASARLVLEVSAGWASPSSRGLWGGDALPLAAGNRNQERN
jgi:hypothetical protein